MSVRTPWSPKEDEELVRLVTLHGACNWATISNGIPGRSARSCRLRWVNQLNPNVCHRPFTPEEDAVILEAHGQYGNRWSIIARQLPGRTDNAVKNHWYCTLRRTCQEPEPGEDCETEISESEPATEQRTVPQHDGPETWLTLRPPGQSMASPSTNVKSKEGPAVEMDKSGEESNSLLKNMVRLLIIEVIDVHKLKDKLELLGTQKMDIRFLTSLLVEEFRNLVDSVLVPS
ncbi:hypothetical protein NMG60_11011977 [Bertholletia excelsa]